MSFRLFGCGKFGWLSSEAQDRELSPSEIAFIDRHKRVCSDCARQEGQRHMALNMLRQAIMDVQLGPSFDQRVLRLHRVEKVRAGLRYWTPGLIGGAIAFVAMMAGLQMISQSSHLPVFRTPGVESHRIRSRSPLIPAINRSELRTPRPE